MEQTCCGQPFSNSGFRKEARKLAQRVIEIFEPYDYVVLPSGSCAAMVRAEYTHLLDGESNAWKERARKLAAKTYELSEFLVHVAGWQPEPARYPAPVTYHDSCHMSRLLHLKEEPRSLLRSAGHQLDEMAESDRCCGFGGIFSVRMPEVANAMTADKLHRANDTGAPVLVTSDPGCLMQMRGMLDDQVRVVHLAQLLEEGG